MLRPEREERPQNSVFSKIARYFGMLMTLIYVALGVFIIFADPGYLNINISETARWILGGVFILYGIVRFIRIYKSNSSNSNGRF
ncbi:hypothetical protein [Pontibacter harenae]|uniref:hypothetical protein n=1 Tax=Pontibacter harenae TaxID=2894083 RepID=UPI001E36B9FC|nr:hypothetical protein [Pontibacter harenae]MCC9168659.1 hypothetical protein [Pontibacter harenae]